MPKTLRYGLVIVAIMGGLFLVAYVCRNYISEWVVECMPSVRSVFVEEDFWGEELEGDSPFANKKETEETEETEEIKESEMEEVE